MTPAEEANAAAIVGSWFWQPAEGHNYRWSHAVRSITRFYESAPMETDVLKLVVEYLRTRTNVSDIQLGHRNFSVTGVTWDAKDVWFQTVPGDKWEGTDSTKIRLYQTLIAAGDSSADGPYSVENGCRYLVTHKFYWDVETLPTLPSSSSGVNYTMQGVTRDRETGLFSCVIECRTRQEQDIATYATAKTIFESRSEAQYLGVKQNDVASKGVAASVGGGVLVERRLTKNEDCTTNIENITTTEESVDNTVVEYRKTLRGKTAAVTDRNQAAALNDTGMVIGETRRSEKTPGGLYNNTTAKTTGEAAGKIALMCAKDIFSHTHEELENVAVDSSSSTTIPESASSASGGIIHQVTVRRTEEGTFDVTRRTTTEESVDNTVVEYRKTLRGKTAAVTDRNQAAALNDTGMVIGETRRSERTPGGLYNNTTVLTTPETAGMIAKMCTQTIFEHVDEKLENVESPSWSDSEEHSHVIEAGNGYIRQKTARRTEDGTWDVTERQTKELCHTGMTERRRTLRGKTVTTLERNTLLPLPESESASMVIGETRRIEFTPGGLHNYTRILTTAEEAGVIARLCSKQGGLSHQHETTEVLDSEPESSVSDSASALVNHQKQRRIVRNELGTYDVTTTTVDWDPDSWSESWQDDTHDYYRKSYVNQLQPLMPTADEQKCANVRVSFSQNSHGSYDGFWETTNSGGNASSSALQWSNGPDKVEGVYYFTSKARGGLCARKVTAWLYCCFGKLANVKKTIWGTDSGTAHGPDKTAKCFSKLGWVSRVEPSGANAHGWKYSDLTFGDITPVDEEASSSS